MTEAEATGRMDRERYLDANAKLEDARSDLRRERDENADLRRRVSSLRDLEADLREEQERRIAMERKMQDVVHDATRVSEALAEAAKLRSDRDSVRVTVVGLVSTSRRASALVCALWPRVTVRLSSLLVTLLSLPLSPTSCHNRRDRCHGRCGRHCLPRCVVQLTAEVDRLRTELHRHRTAVLEIKEQAARTEVGTAPR
jgi:hypothetical protein